MQTAAPAVFGVPLDFILFALTLLGVALSNMYPQAKNVGRWLVHGWHVRLAYVIGFVDLLAVMGWDPAPKRGEPPPAPRAAQPAQAPGR